MSRSFRFRLSARFTFAMVAGLVVLSVLTYLAIRGALDREINASLLAVASIQASSLTDAPTGEMRFHEWELTPDEAAQVRDLNRFAQVWSEDGRSLLRTRYITSDLPMDTASLHRAIDGELVRVRATFQGIPVRSLYYPLGRLGPLHGQHVLQIAAPLVARNRLLRNAVLLMAALILVVAGGALLGSWWLADRAVRPVQEIIGHAEEIGARTLGRRIVAYTDSQEYERLVQVLNTMLARIDAAFDAQQRFTADASHELRSPLTVLRGELELARRRQRSPEEYERVIDSSLEEVDRLTRVAEDLLTLARSDAGVLEARPRQTDLVEQARSVVDRLGTSAAAKGVLLELHGPQAAVACVDADLARRLMWNLIANAIRFTQEGGRVTVTLARDGHGVRLSVADSGPGIPESALPHIFDRFYRADQSRTQSTIAAGTGLGLAIVQAIAELHGTRVTPSNRTGGGAEFTVVFPPITPDAGPAAEGNIAGNAGRLAGDEPAAVDDPRRATR